MSLDNKPVWMEYFNLTRLVSLAVILRDGTRIVSYPRSGRTWLRLMLHGLSVDARFTHAGSKRILHRGPDTICKDLPGHYRRRVLFLLRDPRDTVVSHFHHYVRQKVWAGDLPGFIRNPETGFERLLVFNLGWLEAQANFKAFTAVRYESLRRDTAGELARIIAFLRCGKSTPEAIARTVAEHEFDTMKQREQKGELHQRFGGRFTPGGGQDNQRIVRRGVTGGYLDELTPDDSALCEQLLVRYDYQSRIDRLVARAIGRNDGG